MTSRLLLNVWLLALAQATIMPVTSVIVFVGGIVGSKLAPLENLATLPVAMGTIGTALSVIPVAILMKKVGRKAAFFIILLISVGTTLLAAYALTIQSFLVFCLSTLLFGLTSACIMQFRFAAMESVAKELIPKAASTVLLGGIAAAYIGPEVTVLGRNIFVTEFAGSFVLLAGLFILGLICLFFFQNPVVQEEKEQSMVVRPFKDFLVQPVFLVAVASAAIGYAIMSFIMTATPVSMHVMHGHSLVDTKWVIQSHILAMFLPSLITAWIIKKIGIVRMLYTGLTAYVICIVIAFWGHQFINFWVSLVLLGGWLEFSLYRWYYIITFIL